VANLGAPSQEYKTTTVPRFYSVWDRLYAQNSGPYLLGNTVTYADFVVFQALDNDEAIGVTVRSEAQRHIPQILISIPDDDPTSASANATSHV